MGGTGLEPVTPSLSTGANCAICRRFVRCGEGFGEVPQRCERIEAVSSGCGCALIDAFGIPLLEDQVHAGI